MTDTQNTNVNWEEYASVLYDHLCLLTPYQEYLNDVVHAAEIQNQSVVLDAGCGTGNLTQKLVNSSAVSVCGIDYSHAMLRRAKQKCASGDFKHANLQEKLPFPDDSYTTIVCGNVLYAVNHPELLLRELWRVIAPCGRLVLATPKKGYENGLILKAHCRDTGTDAPWLNTHTSPEREQELIYKTFDDQKLIEVFCEIAVHNRTISKSRATHLYEPQELEDFLHYCGFTDIKIGFTYAQQNLLATAVKGPLS